MHLTNRLIESHSNTTDKDVFLRDDDLKGFGVRISPNNIKSYFVETRVRHEGSRSAKRVVLGRHPELSIKAARESAANWLNQMRQGIDPVHQAKVKNRKANQENQANLSFEQLFEQFMDSRSSSLKPNTLKDYRSTYNNHFKTWATTPIMDINRKTVQAKFNKITVSSGNAQANKSMRILNAVFNYARGTIHIDGRPLIDNPVGVIKDAGLRHREVQRETYIEPGQLEAFVKATIQLGEHPVRDYLLLILLTGLRSREALTLEWKDVDFNSRVFTITTDKAKNSQIHTVPMSNLVFRLFVYRYRKNESASKYVFPSTTGDGHYQEPRPQINKVIERTGIRFTPHDLRRTYASILNEVVGNEEIIKRLLNHKTKNITQRYIQTRVEQFRPYVEAVESFIVVGYNWQDLEHVSGFSEKYGYSEALEKMLYWSVDDLREYDFGSGMPSMETSVLFKKKEQTKHKEVLSPTKRKKLGSSKKALPSIKYKNRKHSDLSPTVIVTTMRKNKENKTIESQLRNLKQTLSNQVLAEKLRKK